MMKHAMEISPATQQLLDAIVAHFAALPQVAAIALAGSYTGSYTVAMADDASDLDIYVYCRDQVPRKIRGALAEQRALPGAEIGNDDFGPGDEWVDRETGRAVDLMYFGTLWMEEQLDRVLVQHQPSLGYSTAFWSTLQRSIALYDRDGWLANVLTRAAAPYPDALRQAIIRKNHPLLRTRQSSYLAQLEKAVARQDRVSVNHRVAALLASYFDILFALNRALHPGEKRLLSYVAAQCPLRPADVAEQVDALLMAQAAPWEASTLLSAANALIDSLDVLLRRSGLIEP